MDIHRRYIMLVLVVLTICVSIIYCFGKSNSYQVVMNGNVIAYIKDKNQFEAKNKNLYKKIQDKFGGFTYEDKIIYNKVRVNKRYISKGSDIDKIITQNSNSQIPALKMKADNRVVGIVANENEGNETLNLIGQCYKEKNKMDNSYDYTIKNKISYEKANINLCDIKEVKEIASDVIKQNQSENKPIITVVQKCKIQSKEEISYNSKTTLTNSLSRGQTKVISSGKAGSMLLNKEVTFENEKISSQKILSQKVISQPVSNIVEMGTKEAQAIKLSAISFPSKGIISSTFGSRWGKMHEGIDIASDTGTPIYAALDGIVTYAGVESGYGNLINVTSDNNIVIYYGHCSSIETELKKTVHKGDLIGKVGSTGNSTGPHLHFEVRVNGVAVDPSSYLK